ncbi:MAG: OmpH family outer membrane protein [Flavobacteriales bacterium]
MKAPKILLTLAIALFCNISSFAQQKIGHVNSTDIVMAMPERDSIKVQLEQLLTFFQTELTSKEAEYSSTLKKYKEDIAKGGMSQMLKDATEAKLMSLQEEINNIQQNAQTQLQEQEQKMLEPLQKKVNDAIAKVAKANKFAYIIDISSGVALYYDGGIDVTGMVKKEMGIVVEAPAAGTGKTK